MTETRKWTFGAALVAIAILVAGWFLLISPKRAQVDDLDQQTTAQEATNSQMQTQLAVLKQQNKDLPEKQAELAALQTKIPETSALPSYIREMQETGERAGVEFTSLTPTAPAELGGAEPLSGSLTPGSLAAINVEMVVTGGYFEITRFVNDLETSSRYTLVSGFTITDESTESDAAKTSGLTATVNARIFLAPPAVDGATATTGTTTAPSTSPAPSPTSEPAS